MSDLISRKAAINAVYESSVGRQMLWGHRDLIMILKNLPSAQKNGDIDEAVKYIKSTQEYLTDIGETWYADYLSDAIDLLVGERGEDGF